MLRRASGEVHVHPRSDFACEPTICPLCRFELSARGTLHRALALALLVGAATLIPAPLAGQSPFGSWVEAPEVEVPGTPRGELMINGSPMLLLEGQHPQSEIDAVLWAPTGSIPLEFPSSITITRVDDLLGLQWTQPLVILRGEFSVSGVASSVLTWTLSGWELPGGAVEGEISAWDVRATPSGPELWIGGEGLTAPGVITPVPLIRFDGANWDSAGLSGGAVRELIAHDEGLPTGDAITVAGELSESPAGSALGVARYSGGDWDNLAGGIAVLEPSLSVVEMTPGQFELWVSGRFGGTPGGAPWSVRRFRDGSWQLIPGLPALEEDPGAFFRLPTIYGNWWIAEHEVSWPGHALTPLGFDPVLEIWAEVATPSAGAYRFVSSFELFPGEAFLRSAEVDRMRWEVSTVEFIRGDVSNDGFFDIADPVALLARIFADQDQVVPCWEASDANNDGNVNIGDAMFLLHRLFAPEAMIPVPAPHPHCGLDLDLDFLDCHDHGFCL